MLNNRKWSFLVGAMVLAGVAGYSCGDDNGGTTDCNANPNAKGCPAYCEANPDSKECQTIHPDDNCLDAATCSENDACQSGDNLLACGCVIISVMNVSMSVV